MAKATSEVNHFSYFAELLEDAAFSFSSIFNARLITQACLFLIMVKGISIFLLLLLELSKCCLLKLLHYYINSLN